ncbi:MAG: tripartite tricarboxylate transporter permease [Atribacterota bacterium]
MIEPSAFILGLRQALGFANIVALIIGAIIGIIVGILPGMGPMVGMVILLPFSYYLPPTVALSLLLGVYCGGYFGGGIPAVLIRTPGVPSSIMTSLDGYPLTKKGEGQLALSATVVGSFSGGIISVLILILLAPLMSRVAVNFGPAEYFMVAIFGLIVMVMAHLDRLFQAILLTCLGLWFSTVGFDGQTMVVRFTFGTVMLRNGLEIAPMCLGFFGIGQSLLLLERQILETDDMSLSLSASNLDFSKVIYAFKYRLTLIKSGIIGTFVGILPGAGSILGSFLSYQEAIRSSHYPEKFGKGAPEGCIAAEAGNNAVPAGAMLPLLTLGIPGDPIAAILISVFIVNGIYPGPLLLTKEPELINSIYVSLFLINIIAFILIIFFLRSFSMVVKVPNKLLAISIMVLCLVGLYTFNLRIFDMIVALVMGIFGYIMLRMEWPFVTWVLGLVLGPIIEQRMRESLSLSRGNPAIFIQSPICIILFVASILIIAVPLLHRVFKR